MSPSFSCAINADYEYITNKDHQYTLYNKVQPPLDNHR